MSIILKIKIKCTPPLFNYFVNYLHAYKYTIQASHLAVFSILITISQLENIYTMTIVLMKGVDNFVELPTSLDMKQSSIIIFKRFNTLLGL